jgi:hypothetical protein
MIIFLPLFDHLALAEYGFIAFKSFTQSTHINNDSDSDYNNDSNYYYYYNDNNTTTTTAAATTSTASSIELTPILTIRVIYIVQCFIQTVWRPFGTR